MKDHIKLVQELSQSFLDMNLNFIRKGLSASFRIFYCDYETYLLLLSAFKAHLLDFIELTLLLEKSVDSIFNVIVVLGLKLYHPLNNAFLNALEGRYRFESELLERHVGFLDLGGFFEYSYPLRPRHRRFILIIIAQRF